MVRYEVRYCIWFCQVSFTLPIFFFGLAGHHTGIFCLFSDGKNAGLFSCYVCCWLVDLLWFWHTFSMCPINPQFKHAILAARQSSWFIDPLGYDCFPHPLQGLAYCSVRDVLTCRNYCLQSNLSFLDIVTLYMVLPRSGSRLVSHF